MAIQLRGGGNKKSPNGGNIEETPEMREARLKREAQQAAAKEAIAKQQEAMRQRALAFEQRDAARRQRELERMDEEELRNNPELAEEHARMLAAQKAAEEQQARFRAEEEAKIQAEKRVQEKSMDQTEALIAAIRAQVEKEKAAKAGTTNSNPATPAKPSAAKDDKPKPTYKTISPEEMARIEEKRRMKLNGEVPPKEDSTVKQPGSSGGLSGGLGGLGNGPTLSNPSGNGPTLADINKGQETLGGSGLSGAGLSGGLGIDITAAVETPSGSDESTVTLNTDEINAAVERSKSDAIGFEEPVPPEPVKEESAKVEPAKPIHQKPVPEPVQVVGGASTIIVEDGHDGWVSDSSTSSDEVSWSDAGTEPQAVKTFAPDRKGSIKDENGNLISVVPVKQRPGETNDVQSAYNIDFDDDEDDDDVLTFVSTDDSFNYEEEAKRHDEEALKAEEQREREEMEAKRKAAEEASRKAEEEQRRIKEAEEAQRKAEEEARLKAEEEARRKAEEEAKRKAEEEARRKAEEEARRKAEEEARRKAEEEARRKAEEEARRKAEEEARRKAEEEARRKAEEEARRKAEEEARRKAEEEARRKAEEEARRKAEEEARRKAEEEARRKAEEEARRKAEEEAKRKAEEEAKRRAEEEARIKAEEEAQRKAEEEALKYQKMAEEARRKAEEARRALEEVKKNSSRAAKAPEDDIIDSTAVEVDDFTLPVGAEQFLGKYLTVDSISDQILNTIKYISKNPTEPRNVVILGQYGFGTTTIAEDFARSFHAMGICKTKTIAKIKAGALNRANISDAIGKLQGGCLVVENAGVISEQKLDEIYRIISNPDNDVVVIMTGQIETLSKIFKDNVIISSQFKHLVQVHRITDVDVFTIAKNHASKLGYPCEPGAEIVLRRRMQEVESGNLDRVLKFVDNAVSKAHNREMSSGDQDHRLTVADFE